MNRLLILDDDASIYRTEVDACNLAGLEISTAVTVDEAAEHAASADIIFGKPALIAGILAEAGRLRWVQSTFAGIEPLCQPGLRSDYLLTGVKELFGSLMSEYVFGYILARERSIVATARNQAKRVWHRIAYRSLADTTIGIVGLGSIGRELARTASHFGMKTLGMKRTPGDVEGVDRCYLPSELDAFLPRLDYLVLVLPDTPDSRNFISARELALMPAEAVLINVGRGSTVNQPDLIAALEAKRIGGAILDVFAEEPLPADNPLWTMDNVVITPHNSAYSFPDQVTAIFCENYRRFVDGLPLRYVVDFGRGY